MRVGIKLKSRPSKFTVTHFRSSWSIKGPAYVDQVGRVLQRRQPVKFYTAIASNSGIKVMADVHSFKDCKVLNISVMKYRAAVHLSAHADQNNIWTDGKD